MSKVDCRKFIGRWVQFFKHPGEQETHPMFVIRADEKTVTGWVYFSSKDELHMPRPVEGVLYYTDPELHDKDRLRVIVEEDEAGIFKEASHDVVMAGVLADLSTRIEELERQLTGAPKPKVLTGAAKLAAEKKAAKNAGKAPDPRTGADDDEEDDDEDADDEEVGMRDEHGNVIRVGDILPKQPAPDPEEKRAALAMAGRVETPV